jgi:hypothetical protein
MRINEPSEVRDPPDVPPEVLSEDRTATDGDHGPKAVASWLGMLGVWVGVALLFVLVLLGFRLGFQLGEANAANNFVEFIYDLSGPLVEPFDDIAEVRTLDSGGFFEPATVIAMGVYVVAALLTIAVLWALAAAPWAGDHSTVRRRQVVHH